MKHTKNKYIVALCAIFTFFSCERIAIDDQNISSADQKTGSAILNVITRTASGDNDGNTIIAQGRIYIFNSAGKCIQLLSTNEENGEATTHLSAGSYTLYAVGGDDLSRFTLPTQASATPSSVITLLEGKVMDDLLMKSINVELKDGETVSQSLELKHKVICLNEVEIKKIPIDATRVEVSIAPLYSSVQLNGEYPSSPTEVYKIELEKQDDDGTWRATPNQMLFPSKGNPTITVKIAIGKGDMEYSYQITQALYANQHVVIRGTYKAETGVSLTGILTDGGWDEDCNIEFEVDNENIVYNPVQGNFCNGYYVVTVNDNQRTAVLFSPARVAYDSPADESSPEAWKQAFIAPMEALNKPINANCGNWRLPTVDEAKLILQDPNAIGFTDGPPFHSATIFCLDGDVLNWAEVLTDDYKTYTFNKGATGFTSSLYLYLRPVIDITY